MTRATQNLLAPYAIRAASDTRRFHPESPDDLRDPFERDRHRIIESTAFRRLEYKTQVFAPALHDHFRTRLTHTLEVAQIARCLAVHLGANETLAEAIALAHDLGHPPFGHAGESALDEAMIDHGGFNHNAHSLRVVEYLEHPFPQFRGLNLTWDTLDGLRVHATRYDQPAVPAQDSSGRGCPPDAQTGASVEAQIASLADRIAYDIHDLEDAIGAELIQSDDLRDLPIWRNALEFAARDLEVRSIHAIRRLVLNAVLDRILRDAIETSRGALSRIDSPLAARAATTPLVFVSPTMEAEVEALERLLLEKVYLHPGIARIDAQSRARILALFAAYLHDTTQIPDRFAARVAEQGPHRVICDYIAGMTDRFCLSACAQFGIE